MRILDHFRGCPGTHGRRRIRTKQGRRGGIPSPLKIMVSGYSDGGEIPEKYTCAAKPPGGSPQIEWSGAPAGTMSIALIFHDGDVHPGKSFDDVTHWIAWNIPAYCEGFARRCRGRSRSSGWHYVRA